MTKFDAFEKEILDAYEKGDLKFTPPSTSELAKFKAAAAATFVEKREASLPKATRATRKRSDKSS